MGGANFLFYNGKLSKTGKALISPDNRSFMYGDGFFGTMKMVNGKIQLADYHFERLFASLDLLQFQHLILQLKKISGQKRHLEKRCGFFLLLENLMLKEF